MAECNGAELNTAIPSYNMMQNYDIVYEELEPFIKRSYEGKDWYYLVSKPFDASYKNDQDWFTSESYADNTATLLYRIDSEMDFLIVKEKNAIKHHLNVLISSDVDMIKHHDKNKYRARWHINKLSSIGDRTQVLKYILKEAKIRYFREDIDYWKYYEATQDASVITI